MFDGTFPLAPPAGFEWTILDWLPLNLVGSFMFPSGWILILLVIFRFFFQSPAQNLNLCNTCKTNDVPISLSCTLRPVLISTFYASFQLYRNKDCVVSRQFSPSELVRLSGCSDSAGPDVPGSVQWEPFPVGVPGHFLWDWGSAPGTAQRGAVQKHGEMRNLDRKLLYL